MYTFLFVFSELPRIIRSSNDPANVCRWDLDSSFPCSPLVFRVRRRLLSTDHATALLGGRLALHLLGNLDVDLEELADTAVEANGLALVELALAVLRGNALLGAGVDEPGKSRVRWGFFDLLAQCARRRFDAQTGEIYWLNMPETISISASAAAIFSAEEGWGRPPPKRKDILSRCVVWLGYSWWVCYW